MIICDRKYLKGSFYSGVPKMIVEILSPSTAKRDRTEKSDKEEEDYNTEQEIALIDIPFFMISGALLLPRAGGWQKSGNTRKIFIKYYMIFLFESDRRLNIKC